MDEYLTIFEVAELTKYTVGKLEEVCVKAADSVSQVGAGFTVQAG